MLQVTLARLTALCIFVQIIVGGVVHATGSSLACPDWPLCFGKVFPEMIGGVLFEHSHRLLGSTVGLLTLALAAVLFGQRRARPRLARRGLLALGVVIVLGVLGGLTVLYRLPPLVSTAHLGLALAFFALMVAIQFDAGRAPAPVQGDLGRRLVLGVAALTWLQAVLGALLRHTGASLACGEEIPLCDDALWPAAGLAQLHMGHRLLGVALSVAVLAVAWRVGRRAARVGRTEIARRAATAGALVLVQASLGFLSVATGLGIELVTAHLACGALLLAALVSLYKHVAYGAGEGAALRGAAPAGDLLAGAASR